MADSYSNQRKQKKIFLKYINFSYFIYFVLSDFKMMFGLCAFCRSQKHTK